ncbi:MAG: MBL fold metallo-hydrolase [Candidatus Thorarchaeota archaeon]|jgi:hydroxyacylglutathione hydrolase
MRLSTIKSEGLAALSYFVRSGNQAMVIDPRRDVDVYVDLSKEMGVTISHIFETHRNEDFVIGSLELQSKVPEARIAHSKVTPFKYGDIRLDDHDTFTVGDILITCLNTPGHTNDSMCYIVADTSTSSDPIVAFTGDTLFVNSVGRTDLVDINKHEEMSRKLFHSLHEKVLSLDDGVVIHPGHGSGSVCGGDIGTRDFSTIGFERKHNKWLLLEEESFVQAKINQQLTVASYFKHCAHLNTMGAPLLSDRPEIEELDIGEFENLLQQENHRAIDIRTSSEFIGSHIPDSISLSMGNMGQLVGWALRPTQNFSIILGTETDDLRLAKAMLHRIGYDDIRGYLKNGVDAWTKSGREVRSMESMSLEVFGAYQTRSELEIIDVREPHEYDKERIEGSVSFPLTKFEEDSTNIESDRPIATICPGGYRSTTAASILMRKGKKGIRVTLDGIKDWKAHDFPLSHGTED